MRIISQTGENAAVNVTVIFFAYAEWLAGTSFTYTSLSIGILTLCPNTVILHNTSADDITCLFAMFILIFWAEKEEPTTCLFGCQFFCHRSNAAILMTLESSSISRIVNNLGFNAIAQYGYWLVHTGHRSGRQISRCCYPLLSWCCRS